MDISGLSVAQLATMIAAGEVTKKAVLTALAKRQTDKLERELAKVTS